MSGGFLQEHQHRRRLHPAVPGDRAAARHGLFAHVRRRRADGRLPGGLQDPELHAPAVRRRARSRRPSCRWSPSTRCSARTTRCASWSTARRARSAWFLTVVTVVGVIAAPAAGPAVRARLPRGRGQVRPDGRDAALDVPVPASSSRWRRSPAACSTATASSPCRRLTSDADEPGDDRVRGVDRAVVRAARASCSRSACSSPASCSSRSSCRSCVKLGLLRRPRWRWRDEGVRRIGRLMLPAIFGSSVSQVALLLDTLIASFLATGSIAWLYYADRLMEFPLGVFSIALATVILPGLAAHHAAQSPERFAATLDWALRLVVIVVLPATVALVVLAGPAHRDDLPLRQVRRARRAHVVAGAHGVRVGPAGVQPGQGAGARATSRARTRARRCASASGRWR